jgi:hypothetical protein
MLNPISTTFDTDSTFRQRMGSTKNGVIYEVHAEVKRTYNWASRNGAQGALAFLTIEQTECLLFS